MTRLSSNELDSITASGFELYNAEEEYRRGVECEKDNRRADAMQHYRRVLALRPDHAQAHNNIGVIRQSWGEASVAAAEYQRAIECQPQFGLAWYNLANCVRDDNRLEEAVALYKRALALMPADSQTRINLAIALANLRRFDEALTILQPVTGASPGLPEARIGRSLVHFLRGELGIGWDEYEGRLEFGPERRAIQTPRWDGAPLNGRSILILSEQGIGDEVMFASCLPDILRGAGKNFIECNPRLVPLFARSFPQATVIAKTGDPTALPILGPCDVTEFLGSLPRFLRRRIADFPRRTEYLLPDPDLMAKWRLSLARLGSAFKVGISWQGGRDAETRRRRSVPLELWEPIFQVPGVRFVNLQHGSAAADALHARRRFGITLDDGTDCDPLRNLDEFSAKIAALDLVLSVDNSTAHLAAAIGRPVWTLLPHVPDWRWMLDCERTPWYSTMRLLRCRATDAWTELLRRTARQLTSAAFSRDLLNASA